MLWLNSHIQQCDKLCSGWTVTYSSVTSCVVAEQSHTAVWQAVQWLNSHMQQCDNLCSGWTVTLNNVTACVVAEQSHRTILLREWCPKFCLRIKEESHVRHIFCSQISKKKKPHPHLWVRFCMHPSLLFETIKLSSLKFCKWICTKRKEVCTSTGYNSNDIYHYHHHRSIQTFTKYHQSVWRRCCGACVEMKHGVCAELWPKCIAWFGSSRQHRRSCTQGR